MKKRLGTVLVALTLAFAFTASPVSAHVQLYGTNCSYAYANFYGNTNFTQSSHYLKVCYPAGLLRLTAITDSDPDNCKAFFGGDHGNWDDCISSVQVSISTAAWNNGVHLCVYNNQNYDPNGGGFVIQSSVWLNFGGLSDDNTSSVRWLGAGQSC